MFIGILLYKSHANILYYNFQFQSYRQKYHRSKRQSQEEILYINRLTL